MFQRIQTRLLLYQLIISTALLLLLAGLVRLFFTQSLTASVYDELNILARTILDTARDNHTLFRGDDIDPELLRQARQSLVWYNAQGKPLSHFGLNLPIPRIQNRKNSQFFSQAQFATIQIPIVGSRHQLQGYMAVSKSLTHLNQTISRLDDVLMGGIACMFIISGGTSFWLTRQAMKPIEASFSRLQQFSADASHELRGPLTAIASNAAVALRHPEGMRPGDQRKFELIANTTDQLSRLTDDLLFLARTDTAHTLQFEAVDLAVLSASVLELYQPAASDKGIELIQQGNSVTLLGHPPSLCRLITNLVENAIAYSPEGTQVILSTEAMGRQAILKVADQGIGIAPEDLGHIFERFWRADPARSRRAGGSGLGLSIVQEVARLHHSHIQVLSQLHQGTTITLEFPSQTAS
jgi:signal transduction histidine kinase